ncbi:hypothetical protein [Bosea psychrotolerans]|uniref:Uncharacterized protein n=1 Tax=Bosea psychrotolerans TaxID=1871628 RepID=A0A2S4M083_9HYPH|nr:hypothetical protein [Bosea psychrotolerans]POR48025.1 hypothetical protein CYD53_11648 [Bosea psychrotolerans]
MADVIPFASRPKAAPTSHKAAPISQESAPARGPAMILFFTGVRYERQAEAAAIDERVTRKRRAAPRQGRAKSAGQPV